MKNFFSFLLIISFTIIFAQSNKGRWQDLFSYNNVKFIEEINGELYCGTENGIFVYHPNQDEYLKLNKTNNLNQVGISAMIFNSSTNDLVIGYDNGTIDIYNTETKSAKIVLDIPWNNYNGNKKVNHLSVSGNVVLISGSFGIATYDLNKNQFLETTFFYQNGNYKEVNEAVIYNENVYAATSSGVYTYRLVNGTNFPNFYEWTIITNTANLDGRHLEIFNNELYFSTSTNLYKIGTNNQLNTIRNFNGIKDLKANQNILGIATANSIEFLNTNLNIVSFSNNYSIDQENINLNYNTGIFYENNYFGGTKDNGLVLLHNTNTPIFYSPDGPFNNQSYSVTAINQKVWIAPGGIETFNLPTQNGNGFYYFDKFKWKHFESKNLLDAKDFVKIAVNPTNDNKFVAVPYFEHPNWDNQTRIGVFEFDLTKNDQTPTHITSPLQWIYRTSGANYDTNGDLYLSSSFVGTPANPRANFYYQRKDQTWKTSKASIKNESSTALSPAISSKYIWFPNARSGGLTVLDKNMNEIITLNKTNADLYDDGVLTVSVDKTNSVWIGTTLGITVLNGGDNAIDVANYKTEPIVIIQNGIPEALLTSIRINAIKVDKANRKWIATNSSGVYYVSNNGEQTIHHFTAKNSPLPSDIVYDLDIDDSTGKVYFATEKGVVSFNGDVQDVGENFNKAFAYPNPVRPGFNGNVTIKNLPERASVKITDVVGNLLFESKANGGIVEWNTKNNKGKEVASGVYLVLMTNTDGTETKTLKIAVVR